MSNVLDLLSLSAAIVLLFLAAVASTTARNVAKRVVATFAAILGAVLSCAALHASAAAPIAGLAVAVAYVLVAIPVMIRLQEQYGGVEVDGLDAADLNDEPSAPSE